jgi:hypothetical protein
MSETIFEELNVEIHKESDALARQLEVGQDLGLVEARERLDRVDFDDDCVVNDDIHPIRGVQPRRLVDDRERNLAGEQHAARSEFIGEAVLIRGFEKAGPEGPVNLQPRVYDNRAQALDIRGEPFVPFVSFVYFVVQ